jgi:hypothetical protein
MMERLRCTSGYRYNTSVTKDICQTCRWCNLGDCIQGAYWMHRPDEREHYQEYIKYE